MKLIIYFRLQIICFVLLMASNSLMSQENDSSAIILENARTQFHQKNYSAVITEVDKGLALYNNKDKDMTYVNLLEYKALAYNWMHDNRKAMPVGKEAVLTYCKLRGENNLPCDICKKYITYYMGSGWEVYHDSVLVLCLHTIFKNNCMTNDTSYWGNLWYYKCYIKSLTDRFSYNIDIAAESKIVSDINNPVLLEYVNYAKGYWVIHGYPGHNTTIKEKNNGITILEQIEQRLNRMNSPSAKYLLNEVYYEIAQAADEMGEYELASINYKKMLDLTRVYWNEWRYGHPWANPRIGGRLVKDGLEPYCILDNYIESMNKAFMNAEIVAYCNQLLSDPLFKQIEYYDWYKTTVLIAQKDAYNKLGNKTKVKEIDSVLLTVGSVEDVIPEKQDVDVDSLIVLYKNSQMDEKMIESLTSPYSIKSSFDFYNIPALYNLFVDSGDYSLMLFFLKKVYTSLLDTSVLYYYHSFEEPLSANWYEDEELLGAFQESWKDGERSMWTTCYWLALAYYYNNDIENAIKYQKIATEIVDLDCFTYFNEQHERKVILEANGGGNLLDDSWYITTHLHDEQEMLGQLAYYYLIAKDYEKALKCYRKKIEAVREILEDQIEYGSGSVKEQTWEKWSQYIIEIIGSIAEYAEEYPPFAELLLECNTYFKGFMLNIHNESFNVAKIRSGIVLRKYNRRNELEKALEESYYKKDGKNVLELNEKIGKLNIELNDTIGFSTIVRSAWHDVPLVVANLNDGDVLVDFLAVNYIQNDDVEKEVELAFYTLEDGRTAQINQIHYYTNPTFYALMIRKGWKYPKVINLGQLANYTFADGKDLIDHIYHQSELNTDINSLYRSTSFGSKIWGDLIEKGQIKRGENLYFCPTSYLNDVAIEYLQTSPGQVMSEQYNMYRLSTIREINKPQTRYAKEDRCVAFGDIAYSPNGTIKKSSKKGDRVSIDMASCPEAMLNREILKDLPPTQSILKTISRTISKAELVTGTDATEERFCNISGNSPEILVIATHGYNYEHANLDDEDNVYLFGERDNAPLSGREKSMYKSGLYMAQSPNVIPTNGMLTAKEISMCDLHNTKLAIIAACVSAVGQNTDEGVFGIQRGLKMAGVQSMLVSLWDVDAKATQLLMEEFVKQYVKGVSAHEALRNAQQYVRNYESKDKKLMGDKHVYQSPYYWAGFILID